MANFLTTNGTSHHIEDLIINAKKKLVLVSPYLQLSKTFFERLKDASNRKVNIKLIYGKDELKPNERNSLAELENLELYFFENLHAKCYFNEFEMVITSMNMYEFSQKHNREMGVYITKNEDLTLFEKAVNETLSIIQSSEVISLYKSKRNISHQKANNSQDISFQKLQRGYCIRCEQRIEFNLSKPYCWNCFNIWSQFENYDYEESCCHSCGEYEAATMNKPLCYQCYKEFDKLINV